MVAELTQHDTADEPLGASRLGHYAETAPITAFTAVLAPTTQIPVLVDTNGQTVEAATVAVV
ncbi:putative ATP-grasp-modified RiPP [Streptomyces sp. 1222.5]|uniref:putative ATP-grasp-modified RiPP n=1 Tax=Streptomyces sp. 1222.5 TaxID=1881026 RepID=UPI003EB81C3A